MAFRLPARSRPPAGGPPRRGRRGGCAPRPPRPAGGGAVAGPVLGGGAATRRFRRRGRVVAAVDGVSLEALPGEIVGLVGPHGSGKTTLLCLIAGLLRPDSGSIAVAGAAAGSPAAPAAGGPPARHAPCPPRPC